MTPTTTPATQDTKVSSGSDVIDWLLEGGFEKNVITTIYGPAGSGKTNICLILANEFKKKKTIYIDTEGSFSLSRYRQISDDYKESLKQILLLNPTTFQEQKRAFEQLRKMDHKNTGVIIIDSIAMLYRLEIGQTKNIYEVNKQLGIQLALLTEIARKNNIPIIITNQVYKDFDQKDKINIVGGDLLKYQSKCLIELQKEQDGSRKAIIKKHRSIEENKSVKFKITDLGIEHYEGEAEKK
ncbi:MAG: DNA repair and recombination protein RadB [Candidatus Woesearchaeota archaeon]